LLVRAGRWAEARREFERAAAIASNATERAFLLGRAAVLPTTVEAGESFGVGVSGFLGRHDLGPRTQRSYGQTLERLARTIGPSAAVASLDPAQVERAFTTAFGHTAPTDAGSTCSALRSFLAWSGHSVLASLIGRHREEHVRVAPIPPAALASLWAQDLPVRERALWLLILESSAPVTAALALNIQDLDLSTGRARTGRHAMSFAPDGTVATVLPTVIAGRSRGPLFITDRRPGSAAAGPATDRCPETGRQRLSYERAEYLFKRATRSIDPTGHGYTLSQLRMPPA
jgi:hypothetical protein